MEVLFREYDEIMSGSRKNFSRVFFDKDSRASMNLALRLFRYSFENYLPYYTPEELYDIINASLIDDLNLRRLMKHIDFEENTYFGGDQYKHLITLVYPDNFRSEKLLQLLNLYHKLLSGEIGKIPKDFFLDTEGLYRAVVFMREAIRIELGPKTVYEYYDFFNSRKAGKFMEDMRLTSISNQLFNSHLEYLHYALGKDRDTPYFEALEFQRDFHKIEKELEEKNEE